MNDEEQKLRLKVAQDMLAKLAIDKITKYPDFEVFESAFKAITAHDNERFGRLTKSVIILTILTLINLALILKLLALDWDYILHTGWIGLIVLSTVGGVVALCDYLFRAWRGIKNKGDISNPTNR